MVDFPDLGLFGGPVALPDLQRRCVWLTAGQRSGLGHPQKLLKQNCDLLEEFLRRLCTTCLQARHRFGESNSLDPYRFGLLSNPQRMHQFVSVKTHNHTAIDHDNRHAGLARLALKFFCPGRTLCHVDLFKGDFAFLQELLGGPAMRSGRCGIHDHSHRIRTSY